MEVVKRPTKSLQIENTLVRFYRYYSVERHLIGSSLLRIFFGLNLLWMYLTNLKVAPLLWGPNGIITTNMERRELHSLGTFSLYALSNSPLYFTCMFALGIILTIIYILGIMPRVLNVLFYILSYSIYARNGYILDGGNNILYLELFFMMFMQTGAYFSWNAKSVRHKLQKTSYARPFLALVHNFSVLAVIIQICLMYFVSFLYKANGNEWIHGTAIYYVLRVNEFTIPGLNHYIYQTPVAVALLTYATMLFQGAFPFLVWFRKTKLLMFLGAIVLHAAIGWIMGLAWFSLTMISVELIIFNDKFYTSIVAWISNVAQRCGRNALKYKTRLKTMRWLRNRQVYVWYDGWCPFCTRSIELWRKWDIFELIVFISFRHISEEALPASIEHLEKRIHSRSVVSDDCRSGIASIAQICSRIPLLMPMSIVLICCEKVGIGHRIYDFVAKRRYIVPVGHCDTISCSSPDRNNT